MNLVIKYQIRDKICKFFYFLYRARWAPLNFINKGFLFMNIYWIFLTIYCYFSRATIWTLLGDFWVYSGGGLGGVGSR